MLVNIFGEYRRPATLTDDEPRMCIKFLRHAREYRDFETKIKLLESMLGGTESTTGAPKISLLGLKQVKEYAEELEKTNEETEKKLQSAMNNLGGLKARYLKLRTLAETKLQEAKAQINVITTQSEEFKEKFKQRDEDYKITAEENRALETKLQELEGLEDAFNNLVEEHRGLEAQLKKTKNVARKKIFERRNLEKQLEKCNKEKTEAEDRLNLQLQDVGGKFDQEKKENAARLQEINRLNEQIQKLNADKNAATSNIDASNERINAIKEQLATTRQALENVHANYEKQGNLLTAANRKSSALEVNLAKANQEVVDVTQKFKQRETHLQSQNQHINDMRLLEVTKSTAKVQELTLTKNALEKEISQLKTFEDAHNKLGIQIQKASKLQTQLKEEKEKGRELEKKYLDEKAFSSVKLQSEIQLASEVRQHLDANFELQEDLRGAKNALAGLTEELKHLQTEKGTTETQNLELQQEVAQLRNVILDLNEKAEIAQSENERLSALLPGDRDLGSPIAASTPLGDTPSGVKVVNYPEDPSQAIEDIAVMVANAILNGAAYDPDGAGNVSGPAEITQSALDRINKQLKKSTVIKEQEWLHMMKTTIEAHIMSATLNMTKSYRAQLLQQYVAANALPQSVLDSVDENAGSYVMSKSAIAATSDTSDTSASSTASAASSSVAFTPPTTKKKSTSGKNPQTTKKKSTSSKTPQTTAPDVSGDSSF